MTSLQFIADYLQRLETIMARSIDADVDRQCIALANEHGLVHYAKPLYRPITERKVKKSDRSNKS